MRQRFVQIGVLVVVVLVLSLTGVAQDVESANDVLDHMKANIQAIDDLDSTLTVMTYSNGDVGLVQQIRLSLLQPDRMRQEYLAPDYLAGNLSLVTGDFMWIYIAAIDTWYEKDLAELSTAEQPWLVFRQYLRGVQDEFDDYTFELLSSDNGEYALQGVAATEDAVYGRINLWVDALTFVPNRRILFDVDGNLLVELRILDVEQLEATTYIARSLETYDAFGELKSTIHYDAISINIGLDPALFERSEVAAND